MILWKLNFPVTAYLLHWMLKQAVDLFLVITYWLPMLLTWSLAISITNKGNNEILNIWGVNKFSILGAELLFTVFCRIQFQEPPQSIALVSLNKVNCNRDGLTVEAFIADLEVCWSINVTFLLSENWNVFVFVLQWLDV